MCFCCRTPSSTKKVPKQLIPVKSLENGPSLREEILESQVSEIPVALQGSALKRSGTGPDQFHTNELSGVGRMSFSQVRAPSKRAQEVFVDIVRRLEKAPEWRDAQRKPRLQVKLFESDAEQINKFKFQVRRRLGKESLLVVYSGRQTLSHFISTVQLSEKVEPDSFRAFLQEAGLDSPRQLASLYRSKVELKGKEARRGADQKRARELVNEYFLETWGAKATAGPVSALLRAKLREIDEAAKADEAVALTANGAPSTLSPEDKGALQISLR